MSKTKMVGIILKSYFQIATLFVQGILIILTYMSLNKWIY